MTQITHCHYTLGKYLGTGDPTVLHCVFHNETPCTPERPDKLWATVYARSLYSRIRGPRKLVERDGDTNSETVLEEVTA